MKLFLAIATIVILIPSLGSAQKPGSTVLHLFCWGQQFPTPPTVYFTPAFDAETNLGTVSTEFKHYLREKYHLNSGTGVSCPGYPTLAAAQAGREQRQAEVKKAKQTEVDEAWQYNPNAAAAPAPSPKPAPSPAPSPNPAPPAPAPAPKPAPPKGDGGFRPIGTLISLRQLPCPDCLNDAKVAKEVREMVRGNFDQLVMTKMMTQAKADAIADCAVGKYPALFKASPHPNDVPHALDQAKNQCMQ